MRAVSGAARGRRTVARYLFSGDCSQVVKVPRCDRGMRGFESHQSPHPSLTIFRRGSSEEEHAPDKREVEISKLSPDTMSAHVAQQEEQPPCKR